MNKQRNATVNEVLDNVARKIGHVRVIDDEGMTHHFNNGSLNGWKGARPNVGDECVIEYQSGPGYGLWFVSKVKIEVPPSTV